MAKVTNKPITEINGIIYNAKLQKQQEGKIDVEIKQGGGEE